METDEAETKGKAGDTWKRLEQYKGGRHGRDCAGINDALRASRLPGDRKSVV